ncbi:MAG: O-acetylhomoserine aminocarboxypropyltransferase/cysteine synthase [Rikenellaceae bacterium]|nr:O-acetylhomoserine aminocarboxypropyltransferase/cysteine synthase [Rikenellaceae bacterium]
MSEKRLRFETRQIHGGYHVDQTNARGIAIHPTAAYHFPSCDYAANLFTLSEPGYIYTRLHNPTTAAYEERVAALYEGVGALATAAGMSAILLTVTALASAGQNIVTSPYLYGGTHNQFVISLRNVGIDCRLAKSDSPEDMAALVDENTRALFVESMGNPTCRVADIEALAKVAHSNNIPLIVDNTFGAGGYLCNPFEWGADIITDSATKWINGHGTAMGGIIVDSGKFDWRASGKFPTIDGPSEGYHGLNLYDAFGNQAFIVKCRVDGMRDFGCCPSPFDAYLMLLGLETLSLRVKHEVESTYRLAEYCKNHPKVERVSFVGFESHPTYHLAQKYFRFGAAPVMTIELKGDLDSTVRFVEGLKLSGNMTMIGDSISVVTHPASTTHKQLSDEAKRAAGITPTLLRISLGLEDVEDIIADYEQALQNI